MSGKKIVRTTLALPDDLLAATDQAIKEGKARSRIDTLSPEGTEILK